MDSLISNIGNWCSILGSVISIITILYAKSIKKHVDEVQKRILYNTRLKVHIDNLREKNFSFLSSIDATDKKEIRQLLKNLETNIRLIYKIVPKEQKKYCSSCIKILYKQYKGNLVLTPEDEYKKKFWVKDVDSDTLYKAYIEVSSLVDVLESLKIDKDIIS